LNPTPNVQTQVLPGVAGIQSMTTNPTNGNNYATPNNNNYTKNPSTKTLPARPLTMAGAPGAQPPPLPVPPQAPPARSRPPVPQAPLPANPAAAVLQSVKQAFSGGAPPPPPPPPPPPAPSGGKNQGYVYIPPQSQLPQTKGGATLICLIPGCGKPVHLDDNGLPASDYCSQRHRE
ncbi:hypothetical protein HWV62_23649, partial [Athelia sp. TMB]